MFQNYIYLPHIRHTCHQSSNKFVRYPPMMVAKISDIWDCEFHPTAAGKNQTRRIADLGKFERAEISQIYTNVRGKKCRIFYAGMSVGAADPEIDAIFCCCKICQKKSRKFTVN